MANVIEKVQRLWRKDNSNAYKRVYTETVAEAVLVDSASGTTLIDKLNDINTTLVGVQSNITRLDGRIDSLDEELDNKITAEAATRANEDDALHEAITSATEAVNQTITTRFNELNNSISQLNTRITNMDNNIETWKTDVNREISGIKTNVDTMKNTTIPELQNQINNLETGVKNGTIGISCVVGPSAPVNRKLLWIHVEIDGENTTFYGLKYCTNPDESSESPIWVNVPVSYTV